MDMEEYDIQTEKTNWPPNTKDFERIARSAFKKTELRNFKVLVYWNQPNLMMFDPVHYAHTKYMQQVYQTHDKRTVNVIIGRED
tara:strand:- start:1060 stop:1311 length:252 start_codon:yes stop_codon:yes gene_type:complete